MIYQIQYVTAYGREVVHTSDDEYSAEVICREYSIAFGSPCVVVREDEPDFIRGVNCHNLDE